MSLACFVCQRRTFNTVGLGKLRAVLQQRLGNVLPARALGQPQVDVGRREVVDVELRKNNSSEIAHNNSPFINVPLASA